MVTNSDRLRMSPVMVDWIMAILTAAAFLGAAFISPESDTKPVDGVAIGFAIVFATLFETGDTVTWVWRDGSIQHDVAADQFRSEVMTKGTFSHTFDQAGVYDYICSLHGNMRGTVFVVEA